MSISANRWNSAGQITTVSACQQLTRDCKNGSKRHSIFGDLVQLKTQILGKLCNDYSHKNQDFSSFYLKSTQKLCFKKKTIVKYK